MRGVINLLYIAYGSNLNLYQMARRCPTAKVVADSKLQDYELLFRGVNGSAVATIEPKEGASVPVLLWDIRKKDECALDVYEGWPSLYRKEVLPVRLGGIERSGMVYVMNEGRPFGKPSPYYLHIIRQGYRDAGFDPRYLDRAAERSAALAPKREQQLKFGLW